MSITFLLLLTMLTAAPATSLSTPKKIAVITGANKGIGKEIARRMGTEPDFTALIACRNVELGRAAADELIAYGIKEDCPCEVVALPVALDLTDSASIAKVAKFVEEKYGVVDVIVNNAAICFNDPTLYGKVEFTPFEKQARITIQTNFFGTLEVTQSFLPLLKKSSSPRIINVASAAGRLTILRSQSLVDEFTSDKLKIPHLSKLMQKFVSDVEDGTHAQKGWPNTCYGVSKLGIIALTKILARQHPEMMVNSVDPGYCKTDQNDNQGVVDPSDGAYTPYLLALMERGDEDGEGDEEIVSGLHFYEEAEMPWSYQ
jgi:carbonyl reductase 1